MKKGDQRKYTRNKWGQRGSRIFLLLKTQGKTVCKNKGEGEELKKGIIYSTLKTAECRPEGGTGKQTTHLSQKLLISKR